MNTNVADENRYNGMWSRDVQNVIFAILFCGWLGETGKLLTIEEVGQILNGMSFRLRDAEYLGPDFGSACQPEGQGCLSY